MLTNTFSKLDFEHEGFVNAHRKISDKTQSQQEEKNLGDQIQRSKSIINQGLSPPLKRKIGLKKPAKRKRTIGDRIRETYL